MISVFSGSVRLKLRWSGLSAFIKWVKIRAPNSVNREKPAEQPTNRMRMEYVCNTISRIGPNVNRLISRPLGWEFLRSIQALNCRHSDTTDRSHGGNKYMSLVLLSLFCRWRGGHMSSPSLGYQIVWLWSDVRSYIVYRPNATDCTLVLVGSYVWVLWLPPICQYYWLWGCCALDGNTYDHPNTLVQTCKCNENLCYYGGDRDSVLLWSQKRLWLWLTIE